MYDGTENVIRELDHRIGDGIEVWLLWDSRADLVFISVEDHRRDRSFHLRINAADALDAFHHPYAYAGADSKHGALAA